MQRGRWANGKPIDYFQPPQGMFRVGLNVKNRYDNGDQTWLSMNAGGKEWAVGFHGVGNSNNHSQATLGITQNGFRIGWAHACEHSIDIGGNAHNFG